MIISELVFIRILITILSFLGFIVSWHIHTEKKKNKTMVCPMNFNCHAVVHSAYSKFLGVSLEIYGMIYYAFITLVYLCLFFVSSVLPLSLTLLLSALSVGAFLFSIYLTLIQLLILKEGCFWCFISAAVSVVIFILTFFLYDVGVLFLNFLQ